MLHKPTLRKNRLLKGYVPKIKRSLSLNMIYMEIGQASSLNKIKNHLESPRRAQFQSEKNLMLNSHKAKESICQDHRTSTQAQALISTHHTNFMQI